RKTVASGASQVLQLGPPAYDIQYHWTDDGVVNLDHPFNQGILSYLGNPERLQRAVSVASKIRVCAASEVADPYMTLGTHPDLVSRLWDELGKGLPADCRYVVFGAPVLLRPDSGVIFGFAGGTLTYALRLPEPARTTALGMGARTVHTYPGAPKAGIPPTVV